MFGLLGANLDFAASTSKRNAAALVVMISASTQGINVTCEVLSLFFLRGSKFCVLFVCVGVVWKMRDETADCRHTQIL